MIFMGLEGRTMLSRPPAPLKPLTELQNAAAHRERSYLAGSLCCGGVECHFSSPSIHRSLFVVDDVVVREEDAPVAVFGEAGSARPGFLVGEQGEVEKSGEGMGNSRTYSVHSCFTVAVTHPFCNNT